MYCIHPNCRPMTLAINDGLCKYHKEEFDNNGKERHWLCSFCSKRKESGEK